MNFYNSETIIDSESICIEMYDDTEEENVEPDVGSQVTVVDLRKLCTSLPDSVSGTLVVKADPHWWWVSLNVSDETFEQFEALLLPNPNQPRLGLPWTTIPKCISVHPTMCRRLVTPPRGA